MFLHDNYAIVILNTFLSVYRIRHTRGFRRCVNLRLTSTLTTKVDDKPKNAWARALTHSQTDRQVESIIPPAAHMQSGWRRHNDEKLIYLHISIKIIFLPTVRKDVRCCTWWRLNTPEWRLSPWTLWWLQCWWRRRCWCRNTRDLSLPECTSDARSTAQCHSRSLKINNLKIKVTRSRSDARSLRCRCR